VVEAAAAVVASAVEAISGSQGGQQQLPGAADADSVIEEEPTLRELTSFATSLPSG